MNLPPEFVSLSQEIGAQPLLVQGPGGNTSVKIDGQMWIKASGTELAEALDKNIFVAVDPAKAMQELDGFGDGSCRSALIDPDCGLRPSIETTFHAMFDHRFVFHFHSVATICHAITEEGRTALAEKLSGLQWVSAPYRKPGIPLTKAIREAVGDREIQVVVLNNHGVIIVGDSIDEVRELIDDVERRLDLPVLAECRIDDSTSDYPGWKAVPEVSALATDPILFQRATSGTYYPDHVVFLGPAMPALAASELARLDPNNFPVPAALVEGEGVYLKSAAKPAQRAMLDCIHNVLARIPADWTLLPIGEDAEAELLNWDAEKYRQALAKRNG
jgi:rhamnose utilization protein RhaD (predicted bifunctional aldolase and dehydrogenase)